MSKGKLTSIFAIASLLIVGVVVIWQYDVSKKESGWIDPVVIYAKPLTSDFEGKGGIFSAGLDGPKTLIQGFPRYAYHDEDYPSFISLGLSKHIAAPRGIDKLLYQISSYSYENPSAQLFLFSKGSNSPKQIAEVGLLQFEEQYPQGFSDTHSLIFSSDGKEVAYLNLRAQIWTADIDGNDNKLIYDVHDYTSEADYLEFNLIAWSKEANKIFLTVDSSTVENMLDGIYVLDLRDKKLQLLKEISTSDFYISSRSVSPDGLKAAYTTAQFEPFPYEGGQAVPPSDINIVDLKSGKAEKIIESNKYLFYDPVFSPDSKKIVYSYSDRSEKSIEISVINLESKLEQRMIAGELTIADWFNNDKILFLETKSKTASPSTRLYSIRVDGTDKKLIDEGQGLIFLGVWDRK